jgi:exopolyphosphatase/guanosine-5'-triphosphate,3'-diphosphate pyrophosphatase
MSALSDNADPVRVCAIDIGTNSVRTIVADVTAPSRIAVVHYEGHITRLGEGFSARQRLKPEAIERTVRTTAQLVEHGKRLGASVFRLIATSAARDARNGRELVDALRTATGLEPQIITGEREAQLVLAGVRASGLLGPGASLVVDVGGGSTELIAVRPGEPPRLRSVNIGAVRLTERFITSDPPAPDELRAAESFAEAELGTVAIIHGPADLVGLGGTITTMAAMLQALAVYDAAKVHGSTITLDDVDALVTRMAGLATEQRRTLPGLEPGREDIIVAGSLIVRALMRASHSTSMRVSTAGILHGIALDAAGC